jgi:flavin-dependent dehydrogenase
MHVDAPHDLPDPLSASQLDVFVAGGGPAGLACAIAAAQRGLTVEVADGMRPPIDKACGEGLMPDTLEALSQLGIDAAVLATVESHPFRGIRFLGTERASGSKPLRTLSTQATFPVGEGRGMRRALLHQLLIDRATALGVRLSWETVVQGLEPGKGSERSVVRTNRHAIHARFVIGADGHQSRIRAWASLDRASISARRIGLRQHFAIAPWSDCVEVYWSNHGQAYVTPVAADEICVAFIADRKFPSVAHALTHFPELQQRLAAARPSNTPRGSITLSRKLHRVTRDNVALVGDASGSVDAVTGEGLGLCFRQSLALAEALRSGDFSSYQQAHLDLQRLPHFMGRTMLLLDSSPRLRVRTLTALQRRPRFFQQMLRVHIGEAPLRLFGSTGLLASFLCILAG